MKPRIVRTVIGALGMLLGRLVLAMQQKRSAGAILLYHRVAPGMDPAYQPLGPVEFAEHCAFIARRFRVLRLEDLVARVRESKSLAGCCAITFDDGYRDFLVHAYPVLQRFGFPVTHFLVSSCLDGGVPWTYRVERLVAHDAVPSREAAVATLRPMPRAQRERWLAERESALPALPPLPEMLGPADLAHIDGGLVEWGSHTVSHAFLDSIPIDEARMEIVESKRALEAEVGRPVRYLAYPNGYYNDDVLRLVAEGGYEAALTVRQSEVGRASVVHALPRFDVGAMPWRMLPLEVGGFTQSIRRILRRHA